MHLTTILMITGISHSFAMDSGDSVPARCRFTELDGVRADSPDLDEICTKFRDSLAGEELSSPCGGTQQYDAYSLICSAFVTKPSSTQVLDIPIETSSEWNTPISSSLIAQSSSSASPSGSTDRSTIVTTARSTDTEQAAPTWVWSQFEAYVIVLTESSNIPDAPQETPVGSTAPTEGIFTAAAFGIFCFLAIMNGI